MSMAASTQYITEAGCFPTMRWSFPSGYSIAAPAAAGYGFHGIQRPINTNQTAVLTAQYGDTIDTWVLIGPDTDMFTVSIDGGAPVTIGGSADSYQWARYSTATTLGTHILTYAGPATAGKFAYVSGAGGRVGSRGIRVHTLGYAAATAEDLFGSTTLLSFLSSFANPKLIILATTVNDFVQSTSVASYTATMASAIAYCQGLGASVLLVCCNSAASTGSAQINYDNALYQLANTYQCALVDLDKRWSYDLNDSNEDLLSDPLGSVHPTDLGYAEYASEIFHAIYTSPPSSLGSSNRRWFPQLARRIR